jgi:hypothetical protein
MEAIRQSVVNVLQNLSADIIESVMVKLADCGCKSIDDCKYLTEQDLCTLLKPVQCRKLLNAWKTAGQHPITPCAVFFFITN